VIKGVRRDIGEVVLGDARRDSLLDIWRGVLSQSYDPIGISILHLIAPNLGFKPEIYKMTAILNFKIEVSRCKIFIIPPILAS
jgi:hypothetical protein